MAMIQEPIKKDILNMLETCQFRALCDKYFSSKFHWIIRGTSVLSKEYHDKEKFFEDVINVLSGLIAPGWKMHILDTYEDTKKNTFFVEMKGEAKTKQGSHYNNEYCWIFQFDEKGEKVIKLIAYYDGLLVNNTLKHHAKYKEIL